MDVARLRAIDWWSRVDCSSENGCWEWRLSTGSHGYGQTWDGTTVLLAHRVAWTLHHGEAIPAEMTIDHICRNRRCCRPDHLRLLTNVANATDNGNHRKTHCKRGHKFTKENTVVNDRGHRRCLACRKAANDARYAQPRKEGTSNADQQR